jgi:hypothetical protein
MAFPVKDWKIGKAGGTPVSDESLEDLEKRISGYFELEESRHSHRRLAPDVISLGPDWMIPAGTANIGAANNCLSYLERAPKTGELRNLMIYVGTQSGNVAAHVYSAAAGSGTRERKFATESLACPAPGWQIIADPKLAVIEGQVLGIGFSCDNTTATFGRYANGPAIAAAELPAAYNPEGVLRTAVVKAASFPNAGEKWATPATTTLNLIIVGQIV